MIRPLRRAHRSAFGALAVLLPVGLVLALDARREWEILDHWRPPRGRPAAADDEFVPVADLDWGASQVVGSILVSPGGAEVDVELLQDLQRPDLLLYWQPGGDGSALSPDATLLGRVVANRGERHPLPPAARAGGTLVLYSLGHARVVGSTSIEAFGPTNATEER